MEIPNEAWIIIYVYNEPSDWIGSFPSEHWQQYYTERIKGLPKHFDSYNEAREFAKRSGLAAHIIVPVAGEQAIHLSDNNERLCNIPNVSKSVCPKCGCDEIFTFHGDSTCMNNDCDWQTVC